MPPTASPRALVYTRSRSSWSVMPFIAADVVRLVLLINAGLEPAAGTTEEFVRFLQEDRVRTEALAKKLKLEPQ